MSIIAFDIGINNLAYCITSQDGLITQWEVINLKKETEKKLDFNETAKRLMDALHSRFFAEETRFCTVLIENQPVMKNPVMKSIQMMIYTFFMMKSQLQSDIEVRLMAASSKLKIKCKPSTNDVKDLSSKTKYKQNKLLAVEYARHCLQVKNQDKKWCELFESSKKKDDLSDSYLMIIYYLEMRS